MAIVMWVVAAQVGLGQRVGDHPALSLHASNEPSELRNVYGHDDIAINVSVVLLLRTY